MDINISFSQKISIILFAFLLIMNLSCKDKRISVNEDNPIVESLSSLKLELDNNRTRFERDVIKKIESNPIENNIEIKEKVLYYIVKQKDTTGNESSFYNKIRISIKNIDIYIKLAFSLEISEYSRHMALFLVKGYFLANPNLDKISEQLVIEKWDNLMSEIDNALDEHDKYSEEFIGVLCCIIIDGLEASNNTKEISERYKSVINKYRLKGKLIEFYQKERHSLNVFLAYYFLKQGNMSILEWSIKNYGPLSLIAIKPDHKKKSTRVSSYGKEAWIVPPPLFLIYSIDNIDLTMSELEFGNLLTNLTNQSFDTADQWQNWYNKNKDNIVWDAEKKKYIVK